MQFVQDNVEAERFELWVDDTLAGFAQYVRRGGRLVFTHTEIDPSFGGRGLGGVLVGAALDAARSQEVKVVPLCSFVGAYIAKHPDQADLIDHELLSRFDAE